MSEIFNQLVSKIESQQSDEDILIRVGYGASGQASGSKKIFDWLKKNLKSNTDIRMVGALGLSYLEPIVDIKIKDKPRVLFSNVDIEKIQKITDEYIHNQNVLKEYAFAQISEDGEKIFNNIPELDNFSPFKYQKRIATRNFGEIDPESFEQYILTGGYKSLDKALNSLTPEDVLEEVKNSGLRGRGGAAFSTGIKWSFLAGNNSPIKYVLCNCEEGDPGAFNDKGILENDPHTLLEGLILAGYATKSSHGHIFIRQGHTIPIENARKAVKDAYENGLLGKNILGSDFNFEVEVSLTGDSYVAGEETALMEAIEGKRSMPRFRPPFPAQAGLWGKPSNINNVKTLSYVPWIIENGANEFKKIGTEKSSGTAIICLSGHINNRGMYEIPFGITLGDLLQNVGGGSSTGKQIKLLQTGGPLGGVLGKEAFDVVMDFDEMAKAGAILGSGGIIVGDQNVDVVDLIRNLVAFNQFESCGKCFPCRLGNTHMLDILDRACNEKSIKGDLDVVKKIGENMKVGSLCGHGQLGYNPISSALKFFDQEFIDKMTTHTIRDEKSKIPEMILPTRTRP
ncbi:MAG: NADH-quinone oxidoreductase subunit F [Dehalococcoidia bacterium]|nr:NADH-quinone oxidoreductase subunit F [Dehalococcoidia bacterium]